MIFWCGCVGRLSLSSRKIHNAHQQTCTDEDINKLLKNYEILKLVEGFFADNFDAKGFVSDVFTDAYEKCKEWVMEILRKNISELFKVQTNEGIMEDLEGLSHAYGLLLQSSGTVLRLTASDIAVPEVHKKVKENIPQLRRFQKADATPAEIIEILPLEKFVQLAWKCVTQTYPVIVCEPKSVKFDDEIHKTSYEHWEEDRDGHHPLIYAQPVVYRSYHGEVLKKGLVRN
jgi:hypothetical protein